MSEPIVVTSTPEPLAPSETTAAPMPPVQVVAESKPRRYLRTKIALAATAATVVAGAVLVFKHLRASDKETASTDVWELEEATFEEEQPESQETELPSETPAS